MKQFPLLEVNGSIIREFEQMMRNGKQKKSVKEQDNDENYQ